MHIYFVQNLQEMPFKTPYSFSGTKTGYLAIGTEWINLVRNLQLMHPKDITITSDIKLGTVGTKKLNYNPKTQKPKPKKKTKQNHTS